MSRFILTIWIFLLLPAMLMEGQRHKTIIKPPGPAVTQPGVNPEAPPKKRFDTVQAEREARELSDLAKSIPLDMEKVNQGLLPKDMIEKLKRIEKLSRHLRAQISPP